MVKVEQLVDIIGSDFYTGVPDSQLRALCDFLNYKYGTNSKHHIIAANEGNCTALAAGYYLATGKIPVVYMQNSGEGNIINPVASLLNDKIYAIPVVFIIGWRGEPGIKDEPQHIYQGKVTIKLLNDMDIAVFVIKKDTTQKEIEDAMESFRSFLFNGKSVAFVVRKNSIIFDKEIGYKNNYNMLREEIIRHIIQVSEEDPVIATTGKSSRELFELRTMNEQSHKYDFLTVGSMGHTSSIALGIALHKSSTRVWCVDGDGAVLMHMGAMAVIGSSKTKNLIHIVINNSAHESVGGMPTVVGQVDLTLIAKGCGYSYIACVDCLNELDKVLIEAKESGKLCFIEVKCAIGSRKNLGRPTINALENKITFMEYLNTL